MLLLLYIINKKKINKKRQACFTPTFRFYLAFEWNFPKWNTKVESRTSNIPSRVLRSIELLGKYVKLKWSFAELESEASQIGAYKYTISEHRIVANIGAAGSEEKNDMGTSSPLLLMVLDGGIDGMRRFGAEEANGMWQRSVHTWSMGTRSQNVVEFVGYTRLCHRRKRLSYDWTCAWFEESGMSLWRMI